MPVETYLEGILHQHILEIENDVDTTAGTYWLAYASSLPAEPFNGDGFFLKIAFVLRGDPTVRLHWNMEYWISVT